jgi:hypothetical protein
MKLCERAASDISRTHYLVSKVDARVIWRKNEIGSSSTNVTQLSFVVVRLGKSIVTRIMIRNGEEAKQRRHSLVFIVVVVNRPAYFETNYDECCSKR